VSVMSYGTIRVCYANEMFRVRYILIPKIRYLIYRMRWVGTLFFNAAVVLLGVAAACELAALPKLETHKLVNASGLFYGLVAALVLAGSLVSGKWKDFCVNHLAPGLIRLSIYFPGAAFLTPLFMTRFIHKPSTMIVGKFFLTFTFFSLIPLGICTEAVVEPTLPFVKDDIDTRWQWFLSLLMLSSAGLQLMAAILSMAH